MIVSFINSSDAPSNNGTFSIMSLFKNSETHVFRDAGSSANTDDSS
ncbi:MAG: hypothetical protein J7L71_04865 [Spirochaetaceae bacterium]|nr:hypothetical protein [Spirochaetaceae bacterium]